MKLNEIAPKHGSRKKRFRIGRGIGSGAGKTGGRVIPVLLLKKWGIEKSIRFRDNVYIGSPINAVRVFNGRNVDELILLDINMPKMNGLEFLKEIRSDESLHNLSVFVMTTSNSDSDKIEAYQYNVAGYIVKPLSPEKFVTAVSTLNNFWQLCERV